MNPKSNIYTQNSTNKKNLDPGCNIHNKSNRPVRVGAHMGPYGPLWAHEGPYGPDFAQKNNNFDEK